MKKRIALLALLAVVAVATLASCEKKRCSCVTIRKDHQAAHSLEELGSHKNCSELDKEWMASDSTGDMLLKTCVPES